MAFVKVLGADELRPGQVRCVRVGRQRVALIRLDDGYYAIDDTCSHAEASLSEGGVQDCRITCPLHGARFDVRTGDALTPPAFSPVDTFAVKVEDGAVWVDIDQPRQ